TPYWRSRTIEMEATIGSEVLEATGGSYCHSILQVTAIRILPQMARKPDGRIVFVTGRPACEDLAVPFDSRGAVAISIENCCADGGPIKCRIFAQMPLVIGSRVAWDADLSKG